MQITREHGRFYNLFLDRDELLAILTVVGMAEDQEMYDDIKEFVDDHELQYER